LGSLFGGAIAGPFEDGQGAAQDYAEAVFWYRKAADQGHVVAQANLGLMYEHGQAWRRTSPSRRLVPQGC
jgi:TPR repeat protein